MHLFFEDVEPGGARGLLYIAPAQENLSIGSSGSITDSEAILVYLRCRQVVTVMRCLSYCLW